MHNSTHICTLVLQAFRLAYLTRVSKKPAMTCKVQFFNARCSCLKSSQ